MSRLSIVIPCLGDAAEFDGTLVSVLQNRPADCEVLVAHRQPYDDPYRLRGEVRFLHCQAHSLVELLNGAIAEAAGEVLHVVGCGLEATENWAAAALSHFADPDVASVSPLVLARDRERVAAAGVRWTLGGARRVVTDSRLLAPGSGRLRAKIIAPTLVAGFYRRDVLVALGGFEAAMGAHADIAWGLALQGFGRLHVVEPASRLLQVQEPALAASAGFAHGRSAERLFWRHAVQRGLSLSLALHAFEVATAAVWPSTRRAFIPNILGRAAAWLEFGAVQRHEEQLLAAQERLRELAELRAATQKPSQRAVSPPRRKAA